MDPLETYLTGARDAAVMIARETSRAAASHDVLAKRARVLSRDVRSLRLSVTVKNASAIELARIPLFGSLIASRKKREADAATANLKDVSADLASVRSAGRKARTELDELRELQGKVRNVIEGATRRPRIPKSASAIVEAAGSRASFLRAKRSASRKDTLSVCAEIATAWTAWGDLLAEETRKTAEDNLRRASPTARNSRIYLPIPVSMRHAAKRAGALYDAEAPSGSRMYVPIGADLAKFDRMLPLSFRDKPPKLSFPPVAPNAAGQAIWGVFDRDTWDRVRTSAYERTGRRCMLCGKQSGSMKSKIFPGDRSKTGPVECHEVWDWKIPEDGDVGIQRLKSLLVLCFECHAGFHGSYMVEAGNRVGLGEQVKNFIEAKQLALTRLDPEDLRDTLQRDEARFRSASNVGTWIMDLSHLGAQDFMMHETPILLENNSAGVPPERVAGLSFVTDEGRHFEARSAKEIQAEMIGMDGPRKGFIVS
jgi:hypothetical protein